MSSLLKNIGLNLIILGIILALFDFIIENNIIVFGIGIICLIVSYFIKK